MGFEEPTPIQIQSIPPLLEGKDVTGQAQTGTGKTAAFGIPAIELLEPSGKETQVLILSPTRELAIQTAEELSRLATHLKRVNVIPIYGGQPINRQFRALKAGAQIVVGTPGRILDHLDRGTLILSAVRLVVLDEADQMLDMGFRPDIEAILKETPDTRQTVLFSATLPAPILEISRRFQRDSVFVRIPHRTLTVPEVEQQAIEVSSQDKLDLLCRVLDVHDPDLAIIFCNTRRRVDRVSTQLGRRGYRAEGLHGNMKQSQRDRIMGAFRKGSTEILVATDVAARGIDVDNVDIVVNFEVPQDEEHYLHRIGRTARAGRTGRAITFVDPSERNRLRAIQRYTRTPIDRIDAPSPADARETRIADVLRLIREAVNENDLSSCRDMVRHLSSEGFSEEDVAAALLKQTLGTARGAPSRPRESRESTRGMACLSLPVGRNDNIRPGDIVGALTGETDLSGRSIGNIQIGEDSTTVEVPAERAEEVASCMADKSIGRIRLADRKAIDIVSP
ncbi:MAG: DEAD/DEAH box helicase [Methanomicrobiales archaeon]